MTLVSSGALHLLGSSAAPTRSISFELYGTYNGPSGSGLSLLTAGVAAGFSTPISISDFYGYTSGSTIVFDFSDSITWATNNADDKDGYQSLVFTGREIGDVITLNLDIDFVETSGAVSCSVYYSINSTSTWTLLQSFTATGSVSRTIPGVDYNDVVRIRTDIFAIKAGQGYVTTTLTGGSFTSGSGTVTASGSTTWYSTVLL